jgi:nucleotide-binding universal stress UspA family protein
LRKFAESAIDLPATADLTIVQGSAAPEIVEYASHREADLIVMGTHGLTGVRKVLFGSTTSRVLRDSDVPVLAVPPAGSGLGDSGTPLAGPGPIVAPVDFSAESEAAAYLAADVARELSRPLLLLHVVDGHSKPAAASGKDAVSIAEAVLHRLAEAIGGDPEVRVVEGVPAQEIARCALEREAILIVMALTGTNQQPRPGSVAYRVLCLAPVPVLAAPPIVAHRQVAECPCRSAASCLSC